MLCVTRVGKTKSLKYCRHITFQRPPHLDKAKKDRPLSPKHKKVLEKWGKQMDEDERQFNYFAPALEKMAQDSGNMLDLPILKQFKPHYQQAYSNKNDVIMPAKCGHEMSGLEPFLSQKSVMIHYRTEHVNAVKGLNEYLNSNSGVEWRNYSIFSMMKARDKHLATLAATVINHNLYWLGVKAAIDTFPTPISMRAIEHSFGDLSA